MEMLKDAKLVIKGERYSFKLGDTRLELTFAVDQGKKPRAIDLTVVEGEQKGKVFHGIYKLEGDTYTVCRPTEPGKDRPAEFATQPKSGLMIVVWKRAKP
jgi:uncharacterized protein (TIGR03067 family)